MSTVSQIRLWHSPTDHLTFDYAAVAVHYSPQGERLTDRNGLTHRLAPPGVPRYPTGLTLTLLPEELTRLNAATALVRRSALHWLELMYRSQAQLVIYCQGVSVDDEGGALTRNLAYKVHLEELPTSILGTLPQTLDALDSVDCTLLVTEDGTFADFTTLASYTPYGPPRP